jgi:hypothetical protein
MALREDMIEDSEYSASPREAANYLLDRVEEFAITALASPNLADSEKSQLKTSLELLKHSFERLNSLFSKYAGTDSFEVARYYMDMMYLIRSTFFIGSCATISDTSQLFAERAQVAIAREAAKEKFEETKAAVRIAMQKTAAKATRGKAYAKYIQPTVVEDLGRMVSVSTIKRCVGVILEERTRKAF